MSTGLQPGDYRIINGLQGPGSIYLYLTFTGPNVDLTVTDNNSLPTQIWTVTGVANGKQTISPSKTGFQAYAVAPGDGVQARTNPCQWNINFDTTRNLYTIQDLSGGGVWDLKGPPIEGQSVALQAGPTGAMSQYWNFTSP